jgi:ribosomal protein L16/L10AE
VEGVPESIAREALSAAAAKMPVRCRLATRD